MVFPDYRLRYPTPPNSDVFLDIHPEEWMIWGGGLQQSCPSFLYVATFINFHQFPSFRHLMIVVLEFCCLNTLHFGVLAPHHAATQAVCWSPQGTWRTSVAMPLIQKSWELSPPGDYWRHWNWFTSLWSRTQLTIYQFFFNLNQRLVSVDVKMWRWPGGGLKFYWKPPLKIRWRVSTWWWVNMKWTKKRETPKSQCLAVNH